MRHIRYDWRERYKTLIKGWEQTISKMYQNSPTLLGKWNQLVKSLLSIQERQHRPYWVWTPILETKSLANIKRMECLCTCVRWIECSSYY